MWNPFRRRPREPLPDPCQALDQARVAYLQGRPADGIAAIRPFFAAYKKLRILDDQFLHMRGLPSFSRWWGHLAALSILAGDTRELEEVTRYVAAKCYDLDFELLQLELLAHRDDRPQLLIEPLEKRLRTLHPMMPTGYARMRLAVARARGATKLGEARQLLDEVALTDKDFAWLADMRILALAEAAHRFTDAALEHERIDTFMSRRPLLFEPDLALDFHLLRYQERLKPRLKGSLP
jgi:hypothetical protein